MRYAVTYNNFGGKQLYKIMLDLSLFQWKVRHSMRVSHVTLIQINLYDGQGLFYRKALEPNTTGTTGPYKVLNANISLTVVNFQQLIPREREENLLETQS